MLKNFLWVFFLMMTAGSIQAADTIALSASVISSCALEAGRTSSMDLGGDGIATGELGVACNGNYTVTITSQNNANGALGLKRSGAPSGEAVMGYSIAYGDYLSSAEAFDGTCTMSYTATSDSKLSCTYDSSDKGQQLYVKLAVVGDLTSFPAGSYTDTLTVDVTSI